MKYGRDELIRSILSPSAAIGYSYRSLVLALADGRVITGLPVEDTPARLVVKTAEGQRITVEPRAVDDRHSSDLSLMPDGLAGTMTTQELVDLLAYLAGLNKPVSIVGQYHAIGPLYEPNNTLLVDPASEPDLRSSVADGRGHLLSWRRVNANAEGQVDLSPLAAGDPKFAAYASIPVVSPVRQQAGLVLDSPAEISVWLNGKSVALPAKAQKDETRSATVELPQGTSRLLIRVALEKRTDSAAPLVTTFVTDQPVGFEALDAGFAPPARQTR